MIEVDTPRRSPSGGGVGQLEVEIRLAVGVALGIPDRRPSGIQLRRSRAG